MLRKTGYEGRSQISMVSYHFSFFNGERDIF